MNEWTAKKVYSRIGLALFVFVILSMLLQTLAVAISNSLVTNGIVSASNPWSIWIATFVPIYCVAFPVYLLMLKKIPVKDAQQRNVPARSFLQLFCMSIFVMYVGNLIGTLLSLLLSGGRAQNVLENYASGNPVMTILVTVVIGPMIEEYTFRKQLIDRTARFGQKQAVMFSALAFGLFHMNITQFVYAFALGLILGYIYIRTRKIGYTIALHMSLNFLGMVVGPWVASQLDAGNYADPDILTEVADLSQQPSIGLVLVGLYGIVLLVCVIAGLVLLIKKHRSFILDAEEEEMPREERFKTMYGNVWTILFIVICLVMCVLALGV